MRRILVRHVKQDMVLARPVYTGVGAVLLKSGTILNEEHINKIKKLKIRHIYIDDKISVNIFDTYVVRDELVADTRKLVSDLVSSFENGFDHIEREIFNEVQQIILEILNSKDILVSLQSMKDSSDYLYSHSVNVCIISTLLGKRLGYNKEQLTHLALGALLHDIGKSFIYNRYHKLKDNFNNKQKQIYKEHVTTGYEIIKELEHGSLLSANIALSHHENYDGSGFPFNKLGKDIHEYARIVAIANEYDNVKNENTDITNSDAIDLVSTKAYSKFDPDIVKIFISTIAPYPVGNFVKLSTGEIALVEKLNPNMPSRPIVRVIDKTGSSVVRVVDLLKELNVVIEEEVELEELDEKYR